MAVLDVGDPWAEYLYVRDITGALADAGAVTCTVTFPDQTTTSSATITHGPTGTYLASLAATVPTQVGRYRWAAAATGANACAMSGAFEVRDSVSTALISLDDAKGTLNMTGTSQDEELRDKIDVITALIDAQIGAVIPRSVSETVEIWRDFFMVHQPIVSLTSLTPVRSGGMTLVASDYAVLSTGKVVRQDGAWMAEAPWNLYTAVYMAGRSTFSPLVLEAARVMLQHLWEPQRGAGVRPGQGQPDELTATDEPALTPRAMELLSTVMRIGIG